MGAIVGCRADDFTGGTDLANDLARAGMRTVQVIGVPDARTVFKGHLFVGHLLLSDSPIRHHPLTPMTDANLLRVMRAQPMRRVAGAPA